MEAIVPFFLVSLSLKIIEEKVWQAPDKLNGWKSIKSLVNPSFLVILKCKVYRNSELLCRVVFSFTALLPVTRPDHTISFTGY